MLPLGEPAEIESILSGAVERGLPLTAILPGRGFRPLPCRAVALESGDGQGGRGEGFSTLRLAGLYLQTAIREFVPVVAARPLQALGLSETEREAWRATATRSLDDLRAHRYWNVYFWYGQKPPAES